MIEIKKLSKRYGKAIGINDISFTVNKGEVLGLLGPNGAGKSTTMNIIAGFMAPSCGSVFIDGINMMSNMLAAKKKIGYLPEIPPLYPDLTVRAFLKYVCGLKGVQASSREAHIDEVLDLVNIADVQSRLIKNLSKGYKQRVGLAQALISRPEVLILDEPTVGLDPNQIIEIRSLIKMLGKKHTILFSSHILTEVNMICERVIILNQGQIAEQGTTKQLAEKHITSSSFYIKVKGDSAHVKNVMQSIDGVLKVEVEDNIISDQYGRYRVKTRGTPDITERIFYTLADTQCPIYELRPLDMTLEDIFIKMTSEKTDSEGGA